MKRGRTSSAELSVVPIDSARRPIEPPTDLKEQEAAIFRQVVVSCDANHFRKCDVPILTAFATATHLSRYYAGQIGEGEGAFKLWEAAARLQISPSGFESLPDVFAWPNSPITKDKAAP